MVQIGKRTPCSWVIQTTRGDHACSFQASTGVAGRDYCKTHAKLIKAGMGHQQRPQGPTSNVVQQMGLKPTIESVAVAQAILTLAREGGPDTDVAIAYLLDGYTANVMRKMAQPQRGAA